MGEELDGDRVHADEHAREAGAGDRHERAVEVRRDRLRDHRLAGTGRAQEQQAALALTAGLLELLARLPQGDHARDLLLGLCLAADVVDLHAPARVAGLVAADLAHREEQERPEEDREVDEEQQRQLDEDQAELRQRVRREDLSQPLERVEERGADTGEREQHLAQPQQQQNEQDQDRQTAELRAPVPVAPAGDDVLFLQAGVRAVQARRRDQLAREDLDEPAEDHHCQRRDDQRNHDVHVVRVVQDEEERRRCDQRDDGRGAGQPPPLVSKRRGMLVYRRAGGPHPGLTLLRVGHVLDLRVQGPTLRVGK